MPTVLRTLGVRGKNVPTKRNKTVVASDFGIGGLVGKFERSYDKAFLINNIDEQREIFGNHVNSNNYGSDAMQTFWSELGGVKATMYIKAHVGYNGSAIDAVVANSTITDQNGLASCILALAEMLTDYDAHDDDAELAIGWAFHAAKEAADHTPADVTAPKTIDDCITKANDLKTVYNAHDADATTHGVGGSHPITAADASDMTTLVAVLVELQTDLDAHAADAAQHTTSADAVNFPLTEAAPSETPVSTLKAEAGYKGGSADGALEYGPSGNRTGYKIENGVRYTTATNGAVANTAITATLDSVIGIAVGDIVMFRGTGATPGTAFVTVTVINESANSITWVGALGVDCIDNDVVEVPGFKLKTYRKSTSGIVSEVETELGLKWCTMESGVTQYYVQNVHEQNKSLKWSDQTSGSTAIETFPDEISTVTYLASGAAGTSPTTSAHWSRDLTKMNNLPVRFLCNPETTSVTIQKAGETYCAGRTDTPIWIATLAENQTLAQLKTIGSGYQRSDDVFQVNVAEWLKIEDPFNSAPNAPDRNIPNVGGVMGAWIRTIETLGIHYIPCVDSISLKGITGVVNSNLGDIGDEDRTILAEYGINIIQFITGSGYRIRNLFTPSTDTAVMFANGPLMRNFIKVSSEDSLQSSENTPNSIGKIKEDKNAILQFLYKLWFKGSTGNVIEGETFGQQENDDGTVTVPEDHFEVKADAINNPKSDINLGKRTLAVYFTYSTPAGSIQIEVGILLR